LSLVVQTDYVFNLQEDEDECVAAISAYRASRHGGWAIQLRYFMDGFWDLIGRKDTFRAFTQDEAQKFIGGICEFQRDEYQNIGEEELSDKHIDWFWKVVNSWPTEHRKALLQYVTGLSRVPAFDKFKVLKASDGNFRRVTVLGNNKRTVPDKDEDTPEHILFVPEFDSREALGENLLHVMYNHDPAESSLIHDFELLTLPRSKSLPTYEKA